MFCVCVCALLFCVRIHAFWEVFFSPSLYKLASQADDLHQIGNSGHFSDLFCELFFSEFLCVNFQLVMFSQFTFPGACNISHLTLSVCSTTGFLQQPQTLVSVVVVLSGLQVFRAHRSVSVLSWADCVLSQREGQLQERVMLVQANVSALRAPS